MNKNIFNILAAAMFVLGLASCSSDEPSDVSIFPTDKQPTNEFDEWLLRNFTYPYNVQVTYRLNDIETDNNYTVVPADQVKAAKLANLSNTCGLTLTMRLQATNFSRPMHHV